MNSKLLIVFCILIVICLNFVAECKFIPNAEQSEEEEEYVPNSPPQRRGGSMSRRFTAWMNFLGGIWKDGNWENGGPPDFGKFIGEQVSKLIRALDED